MAQSQQRKLSKESERSKGEGVEVREVSRGGRWRVLAVAVGRAGLGLIEGVAEGSPMEGVSGVVEQIGGFREHEGESLMEGEASLEVDLSGGLVVEASKEVLSLMFFPAEGREGEALRSIAYEEAIEEVGDSRDGAFWRA